MFDKSIGPSFAKIYYQRYVSDPASLYSLYAENAVFSHGKVNTNHLGQTQPVTDIYGITRITEQLEELTSQEKRKIAILHIDSLPTGNACVTILVGGYVLYKSGPQRFAQNFLLQSSDGGSNYVVVSDCMRMYEAGESAAVAESIGAEKSVPVQKSQEVNEQVGEATQQSEAKPSPQHRIHESWCDEIEREEEELRQQQKRDETKAVVPEKTSEPVAAPKEIPEVVPQEVASSEPKVFSYAAAAKKASSTDASKPAAPAKVAVTINTKSAPEENSGDKPKDGKSKSSRSASYSDDRSKGRPSGDKQRSSKSIPKKGSRRPEGEGKPTRKAAGESLGKAE